MKTSSNKKSSQRNDRKVLVAEESTKSWADSDSDSSSSSSSSSDSEQEEVHCFMADQTDDDEVFDFSNVEFTRDDLVTALNDMVKEYMKLSHSFEEAKAENMSIKSSSIESNSDDEFSEGETSTQSRSSYDKFNKMSFVKGEMIYNCLDSVKYDNQNSPKLSDNGKEAEGILFRGNSSLQSRGQLALESTSRLVYQSQDTSRRAPVSRYITSTPALYRLPEMASSLISNSHHIDFESVFRIDDVDMVQMFETLIATGLKEFLGCPAVFYEDALTEFFTNSSVRKDGMVVSTIGGTATEISQAMFAATFELPTEGLIDLTYVPKNFVFDARSLFSDSKKQVSMSCLKKALKFHYRLLHDILAKTIYVKAGSFDCVTRDRFLLMTAITFDVKINWRSLLFGVLKEMDATADEEDSVEGTVDKVSHVPVQMAPILDDVDIIIGQVISESADLSSNKKDQGDKLVDETDIGNDFDEWLDSSFPIIDSRVDEPVVASTNLGKAASSKQSAEVHMSFDDILLQIPNDMLLPSITAAEVTMMRLGAFSSIGDKGKATLDLKEKEKLMMEWAETNTLATAVRREMYVLKKYREMLLRTFLESCRRFLALDQPWTDISVQVFSLLSAAHSQYLEDFKAQQQEHKIDMVQPNSSLPVIDSIDRSGVRLAHFYSIAKSICWVRPMVLIDEVWTPLQGSGYWRSNCKLSLFVDRKRLPESVVAENFDSQVEDATADEEDSVEGTVDKVSHVPVQMAPILDDVDIIIGQVISESADLSSNKKDQGDKLVDETDIGNDFDEWLDSSFPIIDSRVDEPVVASTNLGKAASSKQSAEITENPASEIVALICRDVEVLVRVRDSVMKAVVDFFASFSLNTMPDMEPLKDLKEKEKLMMEWAETNTLATAVRREMYVLKKYREMLLRTFLESCRRFLALDQPWTDISVQVFSLLSAAHSQYLEDFKAQQQEHKIDMVQPNSSLPVIDSIDRSGVRLAHFYSIAKSICWVRPMVLIDEVWTPLQGSGYCRSDCKLSLFVDRKRLPESVVAEYFDSQVSLIEPARYWGAAPLLLKIWAWQRVCTEAIQFSVSGRLRSASFSSDIVIGNLGVERLPDYFLDDFEHGVNTDYFAEFLSGSSGQSDSEFHSASYSGDTVYRSPSPPDYAYALGPPILSPTVQEERLYFVQSPDSSPAASPQQQYSSSSSSDRRPLPTPQSPRDVAGGSSAVRIPTFPRTTGTFAERVEQARRHNLESGLVITLEEAAEKFVRQIFRSQIDCKEKERGQGEKRGVVPLKGDEDFD
ncbi:hypothetical protein F511_42100 [Dorcoceras hygrometricum]|uniref:Uncharacterized protein n=1 Tax=Dorcoceras hygrometricum TaxID=472368 RepID=A0A2Z7AA70_9LAMI|nr:hypothetical protein F511_42100 [Dorcoceras hygrometricum]